MNDEQFVDACKNARLVDTHYGSALLIGDEVIELKGGIRGPRADLIALLLRGEKLPERNKPFKPGNVEWMA